MIGALSGVLSWKEAPRLLIDVGGVGYDVEAPMSTWLGLPPVGSPVRLRIHHVLREDASLLFGFATDAERGLFRALLKVSGVGPKAALAVLSGVTVDAFQSAIAAEDAGSLTKIPGVGRKTAERLLIEMRDYFRQVPGTFTVAGSHAGVPDDPVFEARRALQALGYKPAEVHALLDATGGTGQTTEDLIRSALQRAAARP